MSREFKVRVYNKLAKCFVQDINNEIAAFTLLALSDYLKDNSISNIDHLIFQQHTGLKDKNGKEIYEGDIIQLEGGSYKYEVVWNKWQWGIDSKGVVTDFIQGFTSAVEDRAVVIDNIFEHGNLIKQYE